ncbi:hypothetical protein CVT24_008187, partial [Panaeolus cyanescens]
NYILSAKELLSSLQESCKNGLIAISDSPEKTQDDQSSTVFATLRTDFLSILALLHAATTKVTLSLKPGSPQYKASLTPLKDLSNNVAALVHSIRLMQLTQAKTILNEYESVAKSAIRAIDSFICTVSSSTSSDDCLRKAGEIHELIDHARKPGSLSPDNQAAVLKKWSQDHDSLKDGFEELNELCQPEDAKDDLEDDGWDELGFESNQKLSEEELARAVNIQTLIKIVVLLHQKVLKTTLSQKNRWPDPVLDDLADLSNVLLCSTDELISSLYGNQNVEAIQGHSQSLLQALERLKAILLPQTQSSLEDRMAALSVSAPDEKVQKWFAMCFHQIEQAGRRTNPLQP